MNRKGLLFGLLLFLAGCVQVPAQTAVPEATPLPTDTFAHVALPTATPTETPSPSADMVAPTDAPTAGSVRLRSSDGMAVIYIPAGDFVMGSSDANLNAGQLEKPQHVVYLDAFWIDQTEVTNTQYHRCVEAGVCQVPITCDFGEVAYGNASRKEHPVVCVDWYDADAYCRWVGGRLPTEAQWEKAARGTDRRIYPWGNRFDCSRGNFDDETVVDDYVVPGGEGCDGYEQTAPVGTFPPGVSPYGALDMAGNVWEWVNDWSDWEYYARSPYRNPTGPTTGSQREVRGGSWHYGLQNTRTATRHSAPPEHRADALGFRCVLPEGHMQD